MTYSIAIAGATGYAGGEILRLLLGHPAYSSGELSIGALTGHSNAGQSLSHLMPHIPQLADRVIVDTTVENLQGHDVVFLALPHGHSAALAKELGPKTVVIDCAADFRLRDEEAWDSYYGGNYPGSWPYGIPEMPGHREAIAQSTRVAVAGCFPTAISLGTIPALSNGLITPDVTVVAVTGVSGAGKKASVALLGAETMSNLRAYNPGSIHRHTPEIIQNFQEYTDEKVRVNFTPVLAPLPRGILATISAPLKPGVSEADVRAAYDSAYADEPFCLLLEKGKQPETHNVTGSNMVHLQVQVDELSQRLIITSAIDNLCKGTAGGAVQCMNLTLGLPETAGLPTTAVAP